MALDLLRRIRSFRVPGDPTIANELAQQLAKFEDNVSAMGTQLFVDKLPRLILRDSNRLRNDLNLIPGQFQIFDTHTADQKVTFLKPKSSDAGSWIVTIDNGGGAHNLNVYGQNCFINFVSPYVSNSSMRIYFCDGQNYWTTF